MTNTNQKQMDLVNMDELALNGVSHLMTVENWKNLLTDRITNSIDGAVRPLSVDFIIQHKNELCLDMLTMWFALMVGSGVKGYDMDFAHRFWNFILLDGGADAQVKTAQKALGEKFSKFEQLILPHVSNLDSTNVLYVDGLDKQQEFLPKWSDVEKNPYFYDKAILCTMLEMLPEVPDNIIDRFIHLMHFTSIMENMNLSQERKEQIINKFAQKIGRTKRYVFPDGTVVKIDDISNSIAVGRDYFDNVQRYQTEDEKAIKAILKKYPRAVGDCFEGDNALAMKAS